MSKFLYEIGDKTYYATCVTPENNWLPTKLSTLLRELKRRERLLQI
jgi:hypothetical protein